jgi:2,3-bisphosphoglycerate-independent phosphoglycerate mutase
LKIKPVALVILDGYGYRKETDYNAIANAKKPTLDFLFETYPHTLLEASGTSVGLLPGNIGNSEVGHLTIGAGRLIKQPISIIHEAIENGTFFKNPKLCNTLQQLPATKKLHIIGLLSDGGVHSDIEHIWAYLKAARNAGIKNIVIHPILDGRDVAPQSATLYLNKLQQYLTRHGGTIGSIHGRFYAMDRDNNWERTAQSYHALTQAEPIKFHDWQDALAHYYAQGITDEFVPPTQLTHEGIIQNGDGIIFFNFRPERARQLTACFIDGKITQFQHTSPNLTFFITPVDYGLCAHTTILFESEPIINTLKDVLSAADKTIFSIAETEKYAHVTYFFNGGKEDPVAHEDRALIPSIHTKNYVHHPEMSAQEITDAVLESLKNNPHDFYLINYANADMVGHSGDFQATIKAIECLDKQIKQLYDSIINTYDGTLYITADHGNAEEKWDYQTKQVRTAHTTNKVPFLMIKRSLEQSPMLLSLHTLADIAPFILQQMAITIPAEMYRKISTK